MLVVSFKMCFGDSLLAKPIRPGGHHPPAGVIQLGAGQTNNFSANNLDAQGNSSVVIRAASPSRIPIVPAGTSDRAIPVIRGGPRGDNDTIVGGSGVSQRIKNAVGPDALPRSRSSRG